MATQHLWSRIFKGATTVDSAANDTLNVPVGGIQLGGTSVAVSATEVNAVAPSASVMQITKHVISAQGSGLSAAAQRVAIGFPVSLTSNTVVHAAWGRLSAAFGGNASVSNVNFDFGLSGAAAIDNDGFCNGFDTLSGTATAGNINPRNMPAAQALFSNGTVFVTSSNQRPVMSLSATSNLSTLSTGVLVAYVMYSPTPIGSSIP